MVIIYKADEDYKKKDTATLLKEAQESLKKYLEVQLMYEQGEVSKFYRDEHTWSIYEESPYTDMYDFTYDYHRYRMGLPIYIDIKLV